ncbi:unnamed protein product [Arabis nemorensis]|uniref:Uncharacterized protein n=1 Tax=Arabis nemorensis TaxID=586526 RepID=A0A565BY79_9BRAS|nr:unnamed protein product [Arabis nemorensis]
MSSSQEKLEKNCKTMRETFTSMVSELPEVCGPQDIDCRIQKELFSLLPLFEKYFSCPMEVGLDKTTAHDKANKVNNKEGACQATEGENN